MRPEALPEERDLKSSVTAPVTALASRDRSSVSPAKRRAGRDADEKLADLSPPSFPCDTPTHSKGAIEPGAKERSAMRKVALDLGAKKTSYCEVAGGEVVRRVTVTSVHTLESLVGPNEPPAVVAIEACREAWHVHDLLTSWNNHVVLVDTTRSRQLGIGQHGRKTDRIDAEVLARALERNGVPTAHVLSPHRRELRRLLGVRRALVSTRAEMVTTIRGLAREQGQKLPTCGTEYFVRRIRAARLNDSVLTLIEPLLKTLEIVDQQLAGLDVELGKLCATEPIIQHLCTVPNVGSVVAASFVSVVDEARRFRRAHHLESYLGLVPSEDSSGGRRRVGSITKKGNSYLRALLVQVSWHFLRNADPDDPLAQWGKSIAQRRGKRIAVIAIARRLAGILWAIWRDGTVYDPAALGRRSARGLRQTAAQTQFHAEALERASRKRSYRKLEPEVTSQS
jgi:transposase